MKIEIKIISNCDWLYELVIHDTEWRRDEIVYWLMHEYPSSAWDVLYESYKQLALLLNDEIIATMILLKFS